MARPAPIDPDAKPLTRARVLRRLTALYDEPRYLEVGVAQGVTFQRVPAARKIAVDPEFRFDAAEYAREQTGVECHEVTSDEYFARLVAPDEQFDVIYLDGLHTFEQTLRDLTNALHHLQPRGVIVIDDTRPPTYLASMADRESFFTVRSWLGSTDQRWMGDVYKVVFFVESFFPSLSYRTIVNNHGQTVLWRGRRDPAPRPSVGEVDDLDFEQFVLHEDRLRPARFGEIVSELRADLRL